MSAVSGGFASEEEEEGTPGTAGTLLVGDTPTRATVGVVLDTPDGARKQTLLLSLQALTPASRRRLPYLTASALDVLAVNVGLGSRIVPNRAGGNTVPSGASSNFPISDDEWRVLGVWVEERGGAGVPSVGSVLEFWLSHVERKTRGLVLRFEDAVRDTGASSSGGGGRVMDLGSGSTPDTPGTEREYEMWLSAILDPLVRGLSSLDVELKALAKRDPRARIQRLFGAVATVQANFTQTQLDEDSHETMADVEVAFNSVSSSLDSSLVRLRAAARDLHNKLAVLYKGLVDHYGRMLDDTVNDDGSATRRRAWRVELATNDEELARSTRAAWFDFNYTSRQVGSVRGDLNTRGGLPMATLGFYSGSPTIYSSTTGSIRTSNELLKAPERGRLTATAFPDHPQAALFGELRRAPAGSAPPADEPRTLPPDDPSSGGVHASDPRKLLVDLGAGFRETRSKESSPKSLILFGESSSSQETAGQPAFSSDDALHVGLRFEDYLVKRWDVDLEEVVDELFRGDEPELLVTTDGDMELLLLQESEGTLFPREAVFTPGTTVGVSDLRKAARTVFDDPQRLAAETASAKRRFTLVSTHSSAPRELRAVETNIPWFELQIGWVLTTSEMTNVQLINELLVPGALLQTAYDTARETAERARRDNDNLQRVIRALIKSATLSQNARSVDTEKGLNLEADYAALIALILGPLRADERARQTNVFLRLFRAAQESGTVKDFLSKHLEKPGPTRLLTTAAMELAAELAAALNVDDAIVASRDGSGLRVPSFKLSPIHEERSVVERRRELARRVLNNAEDVRNEATRGAHAYGEDVKDAEEALVRHFVRNLLFRNDVAVPRLELTSVRVILNNAGRAALQERGPMRLTRLINDDEPNAAFLGRYNRWRHAIATRYAIPWWRWDPLKIALRRRQRLLETVVLGPDQWPTVLLQEGELVATYALLPLEEIDELRRRGSGIWDVPGELMRGSTRLRLDDIRDAAGVEGDVWSLKGRLRATKGRARLSRSARKTEKKLIARQAALFPKEKRDRPADMDTVLLLGRLPLWYIDEDTGFVGLLVTLTMNGSRFLAASLEDVPGRAGAATATMEQIASVDGVGWQWRRLEQSLGFTDGGSRVPAWTAFGGDDGVASETAAHFRHRFLLHASPKQSGASSDAAFDIGRWGVKEDFALLDTDSSRGREVSGSRDLEDGGAAVRLAYARLKRTKDGWARSMKYARAFGSRALLAADGTTVQVEAVPSVRAVMELGGPDLVSAIDEMPDLVDSDDAPLAGFQVVHANDLVASAGSSKPIIVVQNPQTGAASSLLHVRDDARDLYALATVEIIQAVLIGHHGRASVVFVKPNDWVPGFDPLPPDDDATNNTDFIFYDAADAIDYMRSHRATFSPLATLPQMQGALGDANLVAARVV